jgi:hypothetical protein
MLSQSLDSADLKLLKKNGQLFDLDGKKCVIIKDKTHNLDRCVFLDHSNIEYLRNLLTRENRDYK